MRVLRTHAALSLLDLSGVATVLFYCGELGSLLAYGHHFVFALWVPLFVASRNLKQVSGATWEGLLSSLGCGAQDPE